MFGFGKKNRSSTEATEELEQEKQEEQEAPKSGKRPWFGRFFRNTESPASGPSQDADTAESSTRSEPTISIPSELIELDTSRHEEATTVSEKSQTEDRQPLAETEIETLSTPETQVSKTQEAESVQEDQPENLLDAGIETIETLEQPSEERPKVTESELQAPDTKLAEPESKSSPESGSTPQDTPAEREPEPALTPEFEVSPNETFESAPEPQIETLSDAHKETPEQLVTEAESPAEPDTQVETINPADLEAKVKTDISVSEPALGTDDAEITPIPEHQTDASTVADLPAEHEHADNSSTIVEPALIQPEVAVADVTEAQDVVTPELVKASSEEKEVTAEHQEIVPAEATDTQGLQEQNQAEVDTARHEEVADTDLDKLDQTEVTPVVQEAEEPTETPEEVAEAQVDNQAPEFTQDEARTETQQIATEQPLPQEEITETTPESVVDEHQHADIADTIARHDETAELSPEAIIPEPIPETAELHADAEPEEEEYIPAFDTASKRQAPVITTKGEHETRGLSLKPLQSSADIEQERRGIFGKLSKRLVRTRTHLGEGIGNLLLGDKQIDDDLLEELETLLIAADVGIDTTIRVIEELTAKVKRRTLSKPQALFEALKQELEEILVRADAPVKQPAPGRPQVILMVGVNGAGKTTTIGKLAKILQLEGNQVMLAAGDTFRAAAVEQLVTWGERNHIPVIAQHTGADSASVIYDALQAATARKMDVLIADTAGRLHTKSNLMEELAKVVRVMQKIDPDAPHEIMLVVDASTGQNALLQAEEFNKSVGLSGITVTKHDGTAKGGIVFAIAERVGVPIRFIGVGETIDDLRPFDPDEFVSALMDEEQL